MQSRNKSCAVTSPENAQIFYRGKMKAFSLVAFQKETVCAMEKPCLFVIDSK